MGTNCGTGLRCSAGPVPTATGPTVLHRPGAFILPADDAPGAHSGREKLVCIGRRHPRYQRIVTWESAERAYRSAVDAGKASIRLSEI